MGPIALVALAHLIGSVDSCVLEKHENDSVTLQFEFDPKIALKPLDITCEQNPPEPQHSREFFHQDKDKEDKKYQNRHFRDRVQTNITALKDGLFQAQISGLLQGDSGLYSCIFVSSMGRSTSDCQLSVSAAPGPTEEPTEEPQRDTVTGSSKQTPELWAALGIVPIIMAIMFLLFWFRSQIWDWFRSQVLDRFRCLVSGPGVVQVSYVEASTEPV